MGAGRGRLGPLRALDIRSRSDGVPAEPGAFGQPTRATVAAATELKVWLSDSSLRQVDARMLAAGVKETPALLDPTSLTMALAAIGMMPNAVTVEDLVN